MNSIKTMDIMEKIKNNINCVKSEKNRFVSDKVSIIGSPLSAGQSLDGTELACDYLRNNGLYNVIETMGWKVEDLGNINVENIEDKTEALKKDKKNNMEMEYYHKIKNIETVGKFNKELYLKMDKAIQKKNFVLNIGGDHSVAFGSIMSSLKNYKDLRVIWIDAHGDINVPETSPSGNYHGMSLAHTLGLFRKKVPFFEWTENLEYLKPENVVILGLRDVDPLEKIILKECNINYYTMLDIEKNGIFNTIHEALKIVDYNENFPIHVSLDIDGIDEQYAPATGTVAKGGLTYREIHLLLKVLADSKRVVTMDLVEYNPLLDIEENQFHGDASYIAPTAKKTGKLCLELIARILGDNYV